MLKLNLGCYKWMASRLNLFELHHLQLEMESGLLFFFSLLFFKDNSTLLADFT